jgi:hypothetical protein
MHDPMKHNYMKQLVKLHQQGKLPTAFLTGLRSAHGTPGPGGGGQCPEAKERDARRR